MYILDTDHMSLLERADSLAGQRIRRRLNKLLSDEAVTTIISFEEQMRGWTSLLAKAQSLSLQVEAYHRLKQSLGRYCETQVLNFDEQAAAEFQRLQKSRIRIGTMDLKIAAIALAQGATLLSRNLTDFRKVPGLQVEDWAA